jgi:hypothetical protein
MARKPRIYYSGTLYHVMLRGNGGMDLFGDDQDRYRFFLLFQEGVERLQLVGRGHKESRVRAFVAWAILEKSSASLTGLGKWLNRDVSTLSSSVRRLKEQAAKQPQICQELEALARLLDDFAKLQDPRVRISPFVMNEDLSEDTLEKT